MVGLEEQADKFPTAVSSGQQQGAAIARAMATDPSIIVADEPTGNLDSKSADNILSIFERLAEEGKTIIIVTHDSSITRRTDQTIILSDGEIIDQAVARTLPLLSHTQMMTATHQAEHKKVAAGSVILEKGEEVEHFFMVTSGAVDIIVPKKRGKEVLLAQLGVGQFFGEIELTLGGGAIADVRGASGGAELALLPKKTFYELINGSSLTRNRLEDVVDSRKAENNRRKNDR